MRILIIDDSRSSLAFLKHVVGDLGFADIECVLHPVDALRRAEEMQFDLVLVDNIMPDVDGVEMPRMDGLTFLRKIMSQRPIPVVVCSSLTEAGSDKMMEALEAGAVDVVTKPRVDTAQWLQESSMRICDAAKGAAHARLNGRARPVAPLTVERKLTADAVIPQRTAARAAAAAATLPVTEPIICIGASTGGTEALREVLEQLPADCPGIVIVQHMPERFTNAFARRLDTLCQMQVKEAEEGDAVQQGRVLIAPGNFHMALHRTGSRYTVNIIDGPHVSRHRPSVDVLFRSAAQSAGRNAMGILLTGMGDDGARGLLEMHEAGSLTVAQDEATSVVFGMPKEAIALGAADRILPLKRVSAEIVAYGKRNR